MNAKSPNILPARPQIRQLDEVAIKGVAGRLGGIATPGAIGGFSSTSEYECRVQPEAFEKALLSSQLAVAQMFGEKMKNPGK